MINYEIRLNSVLLSTGKKYKIFFQVPIHRRTILRYKYISQLILIRFTIGHRHHLRFFSRYRETISHSSGNQNDVERQSKQYIYTDIHPGLFLIKPGSLYPDVCKMLKRCFRAFPIPLSLRVRGVVIFTASSVH